jgi:hypothetical protein
MHHRHLVDESGNSWSVWEVDPASPLRKRTSKPPTLPPDLERGWLLFECAEERRRCAPIPPSWTNLSDAELLKLLASAPSMGRPTPTTVLTEPDFRRRVELARAAGRTIRTPDGPIHVFEMTLGDEEKTALVFERSDTYWRVRSYPDNWRDLPPDTLLNLAG